MLFSSTLDVGASRGMSPESGSQLRTWFVNKLFLTVMRDPGGFERGISIAGPKGSTVLWPHSRQPLVEESDLSFPDVSATQELSK
jgi:hypothetical protein